MAIALSLSLPLNSLPKTDAKHIFVLTNLPLCDLVDRVVGSFQNVGNHGRQFAEKPHDVDAKAIIALGQHAAFPNMS